MNIKFEELKQLYELARKYQVSLIKERKFKEAEKNSDLLDKFFRYILIVAVEKKEKEFEKNGD